MAGTEDTSRRRPVSHEARAVLLLAVMGSILIGFGAYQNAFVPGVHPANIVHPGADGPSASAILSDFPDHPLPPGLGHDGQQFYAVARDPLHPTRVASDLDRPRYRLQRIAFPFTAWLIHPSGGGPGLIAAVFAVGILAVLAGIVATGHLSLALGGGPLPAIVFLMGPATWLVLRFSLADSYALAAALAAMALSIRERPRWAVAAAILAVLAKESLILLPLGLLVHYRDRARLMLVAVPAAVAATWWAFLRLTVPDHSAGVIEFTFPFGGMWSAARTWEQGKFQIAMATVVFTIVLAMWVLVRVGMAHPLAPAMAIQLAFLTVLGHDVLALDANGSRMTMPLLVLALVANATRRTWKSALTDRPVPPLAP